jgi:type IV fimbrial biogenesis protein FimT
MLKRLQTGVSLIEVMIGLAILAMLMAFGIPQYGSFLANARLKAATDALSSGLSLARAEAVKRNAPVEMVLTSSDPEPGLVNGLTLTAGGPGTVTNWVVRNRDQTSGLYEFIEGKLAAEGSGKDTASVQISASSSTAIFTGFGGLTTGNTITYDITNPAGGACDTFAGARGPMRCLRITVSPGGQIRTCDPAVNPADLADTRRC